MGLNSSSPIAEGAGRPIVWRLLDGKAGHERQSAGLAEALREQAGASVLALPAPAWRDLLSRGPRRCFGAPARCPPDIVLGAGHGTHRGLLAARYALGAYSVVLMRPSLPLGCFDLCVLPRHDEPEARANLLLSEGVINTVRPALEPRTDRGLMLIGGPSRHHGWDDRDFMDQLRHVLINTRGVQWTLADSRRTPASLRQTLARMRSPNACYTPFERTGGDWVAGELTRSAQVWVSEDSLSMIYEALTAGAATGLFRVPRQGDDRVTRAVDQLVRSGQVKVFEAWKQGEGLSPARRRLDEARRVAALVLSRWRTSGKRTGRRG